MYSRHKSILILLLLPMAFSQLYLAAALAGLLPESLVDILETVPFPAFTIILTIVLIVIERIHPHPLGLRGGLAYSIPGFMAPTALFSAWTLMPSHLQGAAWGGIHYFMEAVTRYPSVGPVNSEVFIGILFVLCVSYLPVTIAWGYLLHWSRTTMYTLLLLAVISYVVVTVHLDFNLWLGGFYGFEQESLVFLLYGPVSHTLAVAGACYLVISLIFAPRQP